MWLQLLLHRTNVVHLRELLSISTCFFYDLPLPYMYSVMREYKYILFTNTVLWFWNYLNGTTPQSVAVLHSKPILFCIVVQPTNSQMTFHYSSISFLFDYLLLRSGNHNVVPRLMVAKTEANFGSAEYNLCNNLFGS